MLAPINRRGTPHLLLNILLAVGAALAVNGIIQAFGWSGSTDEGPQPSFEPPSYVVATVWTVLFALLGATRWRLNAHKSEEGRSARAWVTALIIACLVFPFYSLAFGSGIAAFIGTVGTFALTLIVVSRVWPVSRTATYLMVPLLLWLSFATVLSMSELGWV